MKYYLLNLILNVLPPSRFYSLKRLLLKLAGVKVGQNVRVMRIQIWGVHLEIGDNTFIGNSTMITGAPDSSVYIGRNCDISDRVNIFTGTHRIGTIEQAAGEGYGENIHIGNGVWVGLGASIMPGVVVGDGAIIASCACVKNNVERATLVAGVPAEYKKRLYLK
jgi:acetyltransferase-like isoleucine patch superfamily enzyme